MDNQKQAVVINGINSEKSQSPPASFRALFSANFLPYISDLSEQVKSRVRLFAGDTALYLAISSTTESEVLQTDLASLKQWAKMWDMQLNPLNVRSFKSQKAKPLNTKYILHNKELESVLAAKYLGVTIVDDLSWSEHIDITTKKRHHHEKGRPNSWFP